MPKLCSARQVTKALKRAGFIKVSQKGSHIKMKGVWKEKLQTVVIPDHKLIAQGTFQSILNQASMSRDEFERFVK